MRKQNRKKRYKDNVILRNKDVERVSRGIKILFISHELSYTGAPTSLLRMCKVAKKLGYCPIVWSIKDGEFADEFRKLGIEISVIGADPYAIDEFREKVKDFSFAVCNTIVTAQYVNILSGLIPVIWFIREGADIPALCRNNKERGELLKTFPNIYCVSEYAKEKLINYTKNKVEIIHNCVEDISGYATDYICGKGDKIKFIQMGSIEERKGYDVLLKAFLTMPPSYRKKAELYFAGRPGAGLNTVFADKILDEIKDINDIHYLGIIKGDKSKAETISKMDVVVVASRDETCSLTALEGCMLSKPLIVTENVGAKYMVTEQNGKIIKTSNAESLRNAMMYMIDNSYKLADMGRESRKKYDNKASMEKHTEELGDLFARYSKLPKKINGSLSTKSKITKKVDTANENKKGGLIVYGNGAHLKDMLEWHEDLAGRISKVIDKDEKKIGKIVEGLSCKVESPDVLKELPVGTRVAVSAIRYYDEIIMGLHKLNPGLVCPDIDQAYHEICQAEMKGLLIYGVGAHLADMLEWHPNLKKYIARVFDKDETKKGNKAPGTERKIEGPEVLKKMPPGTKIIISAIRYYEEIVQEIYDINPGLVCLDIDEAYANMIKGGIIGNKPDHDMQGQKIVTKIRYELSELQKHRLRGRESAERWRCKFLIDCANVRKVFWGTKGKRAKYLIKEFSPFIGQGDFFVDDDVNLYGKTKDGVPICAPNVLKDITDRFKIIVLSNEYTNIRDRLRDYGYIENVDFVEGRHLIGEDENGWIDLPCVDKSRVGMIVYGVGTHLTDMLKWHPELAWSISRVIDKDNIGMSIKGLGVTVESAEVLRDFPTGTEIVVAAINSFKKIKRDVQEMHPGLICKSIDEVWREYV